MLPSKARRFRQNGRRHHRAETFSLCSKIPSHRSIHAAALAPRCDWLSTFTISATSHGRDKRCGELLEEVGLPEDFRKRSSIGPVRVASANVSPLRVRWPASPELVVLDEPTSALDVLVQCARAETLERAEGQAWLDLTSSLPTICPWCAILQTVSPFLKKGRIVEIGSTDAIFTNPQHAYTRRLIRRSSGRQPR